MALVSITRARVRRIWFFPQFMIAASASVMQARQAQGYLGGLLLPDRLRTFWTMTVWEDEEAMRNYIMSSAHRSAMPRFAGWCDEASVVHWTQASSQPPPWSLAADRMRREGRPSKLRWPSARHLAMSFPLPSRGDGAPILPKR